MSFGDVIAILQEQVPPRQSPFGKHRVNIISMNQVRFGRCDASARRSKVALVKRPGIRPTRVSKGRLKVVHAGSTYHFTHPEECTSNMPQFGCMLAHLFAMRSAFDEDAALRVAIIGEDDLMFDLSATVPESIDALIGRAPKNWEILNMMPSLVPDLLNMKHGLSSPFSADHSHGTVLYCIKRHAAERFWRMIATDTEGVYDLGYLLRFGCRGEWCKIQWPTVRCDRLIAADITLYHAATTYINTAFPVAYWDDRDEATRTCIANYTDDLRCDAAIRSMVEQVLDRIEKRLYGQCTKLRTNKIEISHVPGEYRVCDRMLKALRDDGISVTVCAPPTPPLAPAQPRYRKAGRRVMPVRRAANPVQERVTAPMASEATHPPAKTIVTTSVRRGRIGLRNKR